MKRIVKYTSVLLSGKAIAAVVGLLSFMLVARQLSMTEFGLLMLIVSYKQITNRLINFQTWQAIVKYGAAWKNAGRHDKFNQLLSFCFRLDALTAISAAAVGIVSAYALSHWVDWVADNTHWIAVYCLALTTNYRGFTTGIFRLFGKFTVQSGILVSASAVKLLGVIILSYLESGFQGYFFLWMFTDLAINLMELIASIRIVQEKGYKLAIRTPAKELNKDKTLWSFVITSNLDGMIKVLRELDTLIIASVLSIESAAVYTIAKRFASLITMTADTAFEVVFPETAKLIAQGEHTLLKKTSLASSMLASIPSILLTMAFFLVGENILAMTVGMDYAGTANVTALCMAGATIWALGFPLTAILMSHGRMKLVATVNSIATGTYLLLLFILLNTTGTIGASISLLLSQCVWMFIMLTVTTHKNKIISDV